MIRIIGRAETTVTLDERDGKTFVTLRSVYQSKEDRDAVIASGMVWGARLSYCSLTRSSTRFDRWHKGIELVTMRDTNYAKAACCPLSVFGRFSDAQIAAVRVSVCA